MKHFENDVLSEIDRRSLKVATQEGLRALGGVSEAARLLRARGADLSEAQVFRHANRWLSIDDVVRLERLSGHPHITGHLARLNGWRVVDAGDGTSTVEPEGDSVRECLDLSGAIARVEDVVKAATAPGSEAGRGWSLRELEHLTTAVGGAYRELEEVLAAAQAEAAPGGPR